MVDSEKLELIKAVCAFWDHQYQIRGDLRATSIAWCQVALDIISPIAGFTSRYTSSTRQKAFLIMRQAEPELYNKVLPFIKMEGKHA